MKQNKRALGKSWEKVAAGYLKGLGYEILNMNFSCKSGEVDIIAKDGEYLVFCEVKYRKDEKSGNPLYSVTPLKQKAICKVAYFYILKKGFPEDMPVRFDVVGILGDKITHIKNAFEAYY